MKKYSYVQRSNKGRIIIIATFVVLIAAGGYVGLSRRRTNVAGANNNTTPTTTPDSQTDKINMNPATEQERQATEQHKAELLQQEAARNQTPPPQGRTVTPIITNSGYYDGQVEVGAFVSGVYEDTGTCTATFTKGESKVVKQTAGIKDATTTRCANFLVPRAEFSTAGTWSVIISYNSPTANGSSTATNVEVQ